MKSGGIGFGRVILGEVIGFRVEVLIGFRS